MIMSLLKEEEESTLSTLYRSPWLRLRNSKRYGSILLKLSACSFPEILQARFAFLIVSLLTREPVASMKKAIVLIGSDVFNNGLRTGLVTISFDEDVDWPRQGYCPDGEVDECSREADFAKDHQVPTPFFCLRDITSLKLLQSLQVYITCAAPE